METMQKMLDPFRQKNYYEAVFHLDGTKQNLAWLYVIKKIYQLHPLSVTFNHFHYTNSQKQNIRKALEIFDLDNFMLTARISVIKKFKEKNADSFERLLDQGMQALLLKIGVKYYVPLLAGKNIGIREQGCTKLDNFVPQSLNFDTYEGFEKFDFVPYQFPATDDEIKRFGLHFLNVEDQVKIYQTEIDAFLSQHFSWDDNQIVEDESYWIGSPEKSKVQEAIRKLKPSEPSIYEKLARSQEFGIPLFGDKVRYCTRCCMPETSEGLELDELGICQPCQSSEQKMHIDWTARKKVLEGLLEKYSGKGEYYDCMIPISGGKDSTFQMYILTHIFKRKILAVTFSHNWYSETGRYNLMNAIKRFDCDHLLFTPRRDAIHRLARKSLYMIGDSCWHCHAGVGAFPLQSAVKWNVPFLIWGESVSENDGRATYENPIVFDRDYFTKISARFYAEEMVDEKENIDYRDILPYVLPTHEEVDQKLVRGIHLGDYMFWDDERQMEFVRDHFAWREDKVEGTYKGYKSVECVMAGVHDYSKFVKRGFGRGTDHASQDVKSGLLTREEGFELAKKHDTERPDALYYYLDITGYSEEEFDRILKQKRDQKAQKLS